MSLMLKDSWPGYFFKNRWWFSFLIVSSRNFFWFKSYTSFLFFIFPRASDFIYDANFCTGFNLVSSKSGFRRYNCGYLKRSNSKYAETRCAGWSAFWFIHMMFSNLCPNKLKSTLDTPQNWQHYCKSCWNVVSSHNLNLYSSYSTLFRTGIFIISERGSLIKTEVQ